MGITKESQVRVEAGIIYVLHQLSEEGHGDNVQGQLTLMSGDPKAADPDKDGNYTWGTANAMQGSLRINQAWILYTYKMAGLKVGHMPLALGKKIFFDYTLWH